MADSSLHAAARSARPMPRPAGEAWAVLAVLALALAIRLFFAAGIDGYANLWALGATLGRRSKQTLQPSEQKES